MPRIVLWNQSGDVTEFNASQSSAHTLLGNEVTIVGAIPELNVIVAAAAASSEDEPIHPISVHTKYFHQIVRGPLLFVATDDDGDETDVDVQALRALLSSM